MRIPLALLLIAAFPGDRHPVHSSVAELRTIGRSTIEARVRVFTVDLAAPAGPSDSSRTAYVRRTFRLFDPSGALLQPSVVVASADRTTTTFLVRASLQAGTAGVRVQHAVLWEHFTDQVNIVHLRGTGVAPRKLVFRPGEGPRTIR
jgi:hypothetical protein